ncbi:MAG: hypothetical protein JNM57_15685 [Cyclobacteriaceae bacterium]|nr:hypothetical protein [Cyclobacteriaceae bacterium]
MTTAELLSFYAKRKTDFSLLLDQAKMKINWISNLRLITALAIVVLLYVGFSNFALLYGLIPLLFLFVLLMQKHGKLFQEKIHLENLVKINQTEIAALQGDYTSLATGAEFIQVQHPYSYDLDLFGEGSLFQHINRCGTFSGKNTLANHLAHPLSTADAIQKRQQAHAELIPKTEFRQHVLAYGMEVGDQPDDRNQLKEWIEHPSFLYPKKFYRYFLMIVPALTVFTVSAAFIWSALTPGAVLLAGFQWAFLGFHLKRVTIFHQYISRKKMVLEKFARVLRIIQQEKFNSSLLKQISDKAHEADQKVQALASLVNALDARQNSMTNLVVNSLLLYDLQCIYRLEKWKDRNAANLLSWIDLVSETEALCSISTFAFSHNDFSFPTISTSLTITAKGLGHPLIHAQERVTNDLEMNPHQSVLIITGANMAGKSTFLRTLGVNVVLALAGAPVCASAFECPVLQLRSGMRTTDSLKDHQSYFYAELNRLKSIMDELRNDQPLLILLDEILKGTNSTDKQSGSIALVKQLLHHPCLAVIATHDIVLGELEKEYPGSIRNFCFEASIENEQLHFDYKLKTGVATKMNATFLMKKMGIIPA